MPNPRFSHHVGLELATDPFFESFEGFGKNIFSVYRDRLLKRGIIEAPEYGKLYLKLPIFYEFIKII